MLMVISPAKTLDYTTAPVTARHTLPEHLDHAAELIDQLRELTPAQIARVEAMPTISRDWNWRIGAPATALPKPA